MVSLVSKYLPKIQETEPGLRRACVVVEGPPGTGKSTLCGSMAEYIGPAKTLLIATLPRELDSWKYQELKPPHVIIRDSDWQPDIQHFVADGFPEFLRLARWLREEDDQYDGIILDSGTELAELAWHASLAPHSASTPADMDGRSRWLPYETLTNLLDQGIKELVSLTKVAKRPKHVIVTWHVQPPKDDQVVEGVKKESSDQKGKGVEYEGDVLPMIRGQYRRKLGSQFPTLVYTDMQTRANMKVSGASSFDTQYMLQVRPDNERHTKLPGPLPAMQYIPNDFRSLWELIQGVRVETSSVKQVTATPGSSKFSTTK